MFQQNPLKKLEEKSDRYESYTAILGIATVVLAISAYAIFRSDFAPVEREQVTVSDLVAKSEINVDVFEDVSLTTRYLDSDELVQVFSEPHTRSKVVADLPDSTLCSVGVTLTRWVYFSVPFEEI